MKDVVIIGAGLAGLTAATHLAKSGLDVILIEKKKLPQHKVCGEYISAEILPYFEQLGIDINNVQPNRVGRFQLYAPSGTFVESKLDLGGIGIRRYALDQIILKKALSYGCQIEEENPVLEVIPLNGKFEIKSQKRSPIEAKVVLGGYGKRSGLDKGMKRKFTRIPAEYIGVKYYLDRPFPTDLVTLYNFESGYCGAVQVENQLVDIALLAKRTHFKHYKNLDAFEQKVMFSNPAIAALFEKYPRLWKRPMTIANVSFRPKSQVCQGILMIGDAAGMIPPLAGNGMAMGVHAAKIAAEQVIDFMNNRISRSLMEQGYQNRWSKAFEQRLYWGRWLHYFMGKPNISEFSVRALQNIPAILPPIIRQTHGKPLL